MKRFWIIPMIVPMVVVMTLAIALPAGAGAGKPDCDPYSDFYTKDHPACSTGETTTTTTAPPDDVVCDFNDAGVLIDSDGDPIALGVLIDSGDAKNLGIRCKLTADPTDSFEFVIEGDATVVHFPYIAVTDVYPNGGNICFREYENGRVPNSGDDIFATFSMVGPLDAFGDPDDGNCGGWEDTDGPNTYALTFSIGNAKGGTVQLTMRPQP